MPLAEVLPEGRVEQGSLSVRVLKADGSGVAFPVVFHNSTYYVVASPGEPFYVEVCRRGTDNPYPAHVKAWLKIEGKDVGIAKLVQPGNAVKFVGFLTGHAPTASPSERPTEGKFSEFRFAATSDASTSRSDVPVVQHPDQIKGGRLNVTICDVVMGLKVGDEAPNPITPDSAFDRAKLPEGKKFFLAPSLEAKAGPACVHGTTWNAHHWEKTGEPILDVTLRYETADTLLLREILNADSPQHAPLLRDSGILKARARSQTPKSASRGVGSQPQSVAVKRERDAGSAGSSQEEVLLMDLTQPDTQAQTQVYSLPIKMESSQCPRLQRDEVAVCDLAGDVEPVWEVRKKPCVEC